MKGTQDIQKEERDLIEKIKALYQQPYSHKKMDEIDMLEKQRERMHKDCARHFCFNESISVAQIQNFVKILKAYVHPVYAKVSLERLLCVLPDGISSQDELAVVAKHLGWRKLFYVHTPDYPELEYTSEYKKQVLDVIVAFNLYTMQEQFGKLENDIRAEDASAIADLLTTSYTLTNSTLGELLFFGDYPLGGYRFHDKFAPCITYIDLLRNLRFGILHLSECEESKKLETCIKYILMDFKYQCRYLAFMTCLTDVLSFPGLTEEEKEVMNNLTGFFLHNFTNPYIYHIVVEKERLYETVPVNQRESRHNTTRIKLYLNTYGDEKPQMIRLDLPHQKGEDSKNCEDCVHINWEIGDENRHIPLSAPDADGRYNRVYDHLAVALQEMAFKTAFTYHSPSATDKAILKLMPDLTNMMIYSEHVIDKIINGDYAHMKTVRQDLAYCHMLKMIHEDGRFDIMDLDKVDVFECADMLMSDDMKI